MKMYRVQHNVDSLLKVHEYTQDRYFTTIEQAMNYFCLVRDKVRLDRDEYVECIEMDVTRNDVIGDLRSEYVCTIAVYSCDTKAGLWHMKKAS